MLGKLPGETRKGEFKAWLAFLIPVGIFSIIMGYMFLRDVGVLK